MRIVNALIEDVTDKFGKHNDNHDRQTDTDIACGLHDDNSEWDGHSYNSAQLASGSNQSVLSNAIRRDDVQLEERKTDGPAPSSTD